VPGDHVALTASVPASDTMVPGAGVDVAIAATDWQFASLAWNGGSYTASVSRSDKAGHIRVWPSTKRWVISAVMNCAPGNANWDEYGMLDRTIRAPGIPVFVPVNVTVNGTNSYWRMISSYYTAVAGSIGRLSGSSNTPSN
jgi:hypothetical protein